MIGAASNGGLKPGCDLIAMAARKKLKERTTMETTIQTTPVTCTEAFLIWAQTERCDHSHWKAGVGRHPDIWVCERERRWRDYCSIRDGVDYHVTEEGWESMNRRAAGLERARIKAAENRKKMPIAETLFAPAIGG